MRNRNIVEIRVAIRQYKNYWWACLFGKPDIEVTGPTEEDVKSQIRDHLYEQQSLGQYPPQGGLRNHVRLPTAPTKPLALLPRLMGA